MTARLPDSVEMLAELVAIPSVSSPDAALDQSNRLVVDRLAGWLDALGFAIEIQPLPRQQHKANLIATLGRGYGGLVLAGHTDTVPVDPARWTSDPFTLTERDGRLYGLGTADMKGFFPLAIEAARRFRAGDLHEPLTLLATADEESSMDGALALLDAKRPAASFCVIGEPTGLAPVRMHKGVIMQSVRITGRAAHSSDPSQGANALEAMQAVMAALLELRTEWQARHRHEGFPVPVPTLNLGLIRGGDAANRVCPECELQFDVRLMPGMKRDAVRAEIGERARRAVAGSGVEIEVGALFPGIPAFETPAESELVRVAEELTGRKAGVVAFGTEAPFFHRLGMQTIVLGPGDIGVAHQPDEHLPRDRLRPTVDLLAGFIDRFCVRGRAL